MTKSSVRGGNANLYGGAKGAKMTRGKAGKGGLIKTPSSAIAKK